MKESINWLNDGKTPGIMAGETCHIACDHYRRFREDAALMKQKGLRSCRFSVSWPRFGLIHVDYKTQKRTVKETGWQYAQISRSNGSNL